MRTAAAKDPKVTGSVTMARFFRVLGDPTRLRIIEILSEGECSAGQLVAAVGGLQPRVSAHLACLRHCGFVESERRGRQVVYRLTFDGLDGLLSDADGVAAAAAARLASCTRIGPDWT
ncbi:MAG: ArsR/SmtB family transcription factor [Actinomycetota bacterium]